MSMVETHRVVITGLGAVTPAGFGVDALWGAVLEGRSCITLLTRHDADYLGVRVAGQVPDYDPTEHGFDRREARRFGRFIQYAIMASDEAFEQSGIDLGSEDTSRFACSFGSGIGGMQELTDAVRTIDTKGPRRVNPLLIPSMISNMAAGDLAIRYGLRGACTCTVTACATGTHCIGEAYRSIKYGYADAALAGGTEESISEIGITGFRNLGALCNEDDPAHASRPFDLNRSGFVIAEGAAAVILESLEHAQKRNANIIAEIVGFGSTGDAYHMTSPNPNGEGVVRAMREALNEAGFTPQDLGHLNAHGTSTIINDRVESAALHLLCGDVAHTVPVTSVKGVTGHMLGAAGAAEAIVTALSVAHDIVPPTAGFEMSDTECPVRVLKEPLRSYPQKLAVSNSIGFGGHNASLAIAPFRS